MVVSGFLWEIDFEGCSETRLLDATLTILGGTYCTSTQPLFAAFKPAREPNRCSSQPLPHEAYFLRVLLQYSHAHWVWATRGGLSSTRDGGFEASGFAHGCRIPLQPRILPEPWEDPKHGSTLGLCNLHDRSIRVQNWFQFLGSSQGSGYYSSSALGGAGASKFGAGMQIE